MLDFWHFFCDMSCGGSFLIMAIWGSVCLTYPNVKFFPHIWIVSAVISINRFFMPFLLSLIPFNLRSVFFMSSSSSWIHFWGSVVLYMVSLSNWSLTSALSSVSNTILTLVTSAAHAFNRIYNLLDFCLDLTDHVVHCFV